MAAGKRVLRPLRKGREYNIKCAFLRFVIVIMTSTYLIFDVMLNGE